MTSSREQPTLALWLDESWTTSYRTACLLLGNPADAEEAVQDAYLRVWRFRDSLRHGADYRPWLYRVVVNACHDKLRTEIPHRDRRTSDDALTHVGVDGPEDKIAAATGLAGALATLSQELRTVVVLRYFADLSERDIARAIDRPAGTVKSRLAEARRQLATHPDVRVLAGRSASPDAEEAQ
jgi:RNA polymerase sigma-70 factor, ECF subfamily